MLFLPFCPCDPRVETIERILSTDGADKERNKNVLKFLSVSWASGGNGTENSIATGDGAEWRDPSARIRPIADIRPVARLVPSGKISRRTSARAKRLTAPLMLGVAKVLNGATDD